MNRQQLERRRKTNPVRKLGKKFEIQICGKVNFVGTILLAFVYKLT